MLITNYLIIRNIKIIHVTTDKNGQDYNNDDQWNIKPNLDKKIY